MTVFELFLIVLTTLVYGDFDQWFSTKTDYSAESDSLLTLNLCVFAVCTQAMLYNLNRSIKLDCLRERQLVANEIFKQSVQTKKGQGWLLNALDQDEQMRPMLSTL